MNDQPWLLSKKDTLLNLLNGVPPEEADLNPDYYEIPILYASVRLASRGVDGVPDFDKINPHDFDTTNEFFSYIRDSVGDIFEFNQDETIAKAASEVLKRIPSEMLINDMNSRET